MTIPSLGYLAIEAATLLVDDLPPGYGFVVLAFPVQAVDGSSDGDFASAVAITSHGPEITDRALMYYLLTRSPTRQIPLDTPSGE